MSGVELSAFRCYARATVAKAFRQGGSGRNHEGKGQLSTTRIWHTRHGENFGKQSAKNTCLICWHRGQNQLTTSQFVRNGAATLQ